MAVQYEAAAARDGAVLTPAVCRPQQDPFLRNLESRFALQQKIVEAAKKLAGEPELCKTVKKKRRRNCLDAMHKLQQIEDEMNQYRIKMGKKPTQRASVIIAGTWRPWAPAAAVLRLLPQTPVAFFPFNR